MRQKSSPGRGRVVTGDEFSVGRATFRTCSETLQVPSVSWFHHGFLVMLRFTSSARVWLLSPWGHPSLLSPPSPAPSSFSARQPKDSVLRCSWICFLCGQPPSPPLQSFKFLPLLLTPSFPPGTPTSRPPQLTAHQPSDWT